MVSLEKTITYFNKCIKCYGSIDSHPLNAGHCSLARDKYWEKKSVPICYLNENEIFPDNFSLIGSAVSVKQT